MKSDERQVVVVTGVKAVLTLRDRSLLMRDEKDFAKGRRNEKTLVTVAALPRVQFREV